jgi:hypothetical protein
MSSEEGLSSGMMGKSSSWFQIVPALLFSGLAAWLALASGAAPVFAQEETAAVETDAAAAPALLGPDELRKLVSRLRSPTTCRHRPGSDQPAADRGVVIPRQSKSDRI